MDLWSAIGLAMFAVGMALHARAHQRLKGVTDFGLVMPPLRYIDDGLYRLRHPAYIGNLLEIAGAGIIFLGWRGWVLAFAALPFYADRIYREERIRQVIETDAEKRPKAA